MFVEAACSPLTGRRDGQLSGAEFVLAMHFASIARTGLALPATIPEHLIPGHKAEPEHVEPEHVEAPTRAQPVHAPAPVHVEAPTRAQPVHAPAPLHVEPAPTHVAAVHMEISSEQDQSHAGPPPILDTFGLEPAHAEPAYAAAPNEDVVEHAAESVADSIVTEAVSDAAVEVVHESRLQRSNHVQFDDTPSEAPPPIPDDAPPADEPPPIPDETVPGESSIDHPSEEPAVEVCSWRSLLVFSSITG